MKKSISILKFFFFLSCLINPIGALALELPLKKAVELTIRNNPTVLQAMADYIALRGQIAARKGVYDWTTELAYQYADTEQARVVTFQPSRTKETTYEASLGKMFSLGTIFGVTSSILKTEDDSSFNLLSTSRYQSNLGFTLEQPLLDGFLGLPDLTLLKTDDMRMKALEFQIWRDLEGVVADMATMYWELWTEDQFYAIAKESEAEAKDFLNETRRLSKVGLREEDEILQAETSWLQRSEETLQAKNRQQNSWVRLRKKIGISTDSKWDALPKLDPPQWGSAISTEEVLKQAYRMRGDFLSAELRMELNKDLKQSLRFNVLPALNISGGYALTGLDPKLSESIEQVRNHRINGWNIGMSLTHSFGQNLDRSEMDAAEAAHVRAQSIYSDLSNAIIQDVTTNVNDYHANLKRLGLSKKIEAKRDRIEKLFLKKFKNGRIAIQDLLRAQEEHRQSRYLYQVSQSRLVLNQMQINMAKGDFLRQFGFDSFQDVKNVREGGNP